MLCVLIALFMLCQKTPLTAIDGDVVERQYIDALAHTFQGFVQQGGKEIWPHFDLLDRPLLFHFSNGHVYAHGLKFASHVWEEKRVHQRPIFYCSHFPSSLPLLQPGYLLENQKVFVMSLDHGKNGSSLPLLTFIHERFHITQFEVFNKESVVEAELSDYQNINLLAWMEMEHRLLTSFLKTENVELKLQYLKDFVAISHNRRQSLNPATVSWENHQQKMEGLADYVSVKTFGVFATIANFKAEEALIEMRQMKCNSIVTTQDALKGRHYFVGAVLGLALDFCLVENWKERIERGGVSLHEMLEDALSMDDNEMRARLFLLEDSLNWKGICSQISQVMEKEKEENEKVIQLFGAQEGVVIHMGTPSGPMSSGGSHRKKYQIDRQKVLMQDTSQATTQDQMWVINFHAIAIVFEDQNGDRVFKLDSKTALQIDEQEFTIGEILQKNPMKLSFSSLSIKDTYCVLDSLRSGILFVKEGEIFFSFN